jgi:methyl coenzyme M reductase subunit C
MLTSSAVTISSGSGIPAAAMRRKASVLGAEVTMAH